jgi:chorismate mutase-like protein
MAVPQPVPPSDLSLEALRQEIDAIDDAVQDLLIQRAALVAEVATAKAREGKRAPLFRPGREAAIMRRLISRNRSPLPPEVVIRVWREIISALTHLQGPFAVAASTPKCVELARDHFGSAALQSVSSVAAIVNAVAKGRAQLGVLPLPTPAPRGDAAWWRSMPPGVQIVGRLPFLVRGAPREGSGGLVIGRQPFEPSGDDGAFFMIETTATVGAVRAALQVSGFAPGQVVMATGKNGTKMFLVETETWRPDEAARLTRLAEQIGGTAQVLGGFARPIVIAP